VKPALEIFTRHQFAGGARSLPPPAHPAPPVPICISLFGAASFVVISITDCVESLSFVSSDCILKTSFSIFLSVVSDGQGHLELATMWGSVWGRTFLV